MKTVKLIVGLTLMIAFPQLSAARSDTSDTPEVLVAEPDGVKGEESAPSPKSEAKPSDTKSDTFDICVRATQRFEKQEKADGKQEGTTKVTPMSASCKTELKPAPYWICMDKEAIEGVDFNTAHWHCAKKTNLLN